MPLSLPDETRPRLVAALKGYCRDALDEPIGDLQASLLLDFVLAEIAPSVYNQAIRDAQASLHAVVADLDLTLHAPDGGHADRRTPRPHR